MKPYAGEACSRDWSWDTADEQEFGPICLVTVFDRNPDEAWYLVTGLEVRPAEQRIRNYKRRVCQVRLPVRILFFHEATNTLQMLLL